MRLDDWYPQGKRCRQIHQDGDTGIPLNYNCIMVEHCMFAQPVARGIHYNSETGNCVRRYIRRLRDADLMSADIAMLKEFGNDC